MDKWLENIKSSLGERSNLSRENLYEKYYSGKNLVKTDVLACLDFIESETGLSAGLLRPDDPFTMLTTSPPTESSLRKYLWDAWGEDFESEINARLTLQLRKHGTYDHWTRIETVGDLISAFAGGTPSA